MQLLETQKPTYLAVAFDLAAPSFRHEADVNYKANRQVEIYRQGKEVEILENPTDLSGEDVLPNFSLKYVQLMN